MQCNAARLQCNTCSRLKTSVNSVHLAPRRTLFSGRCFSCASQRLQGFQDLQGSAQDKCVFCREASSAGEGVSLLQGGNLKERGFVCHLQGWDYACRAADIKHLSAGSLPGTPVGRAVVLKKFGFTNLSL